MGPFVAGTEEGGQRKKEDGLASLTGSRLCEARREGPQIQMYVELLI